MISKLLGKKEAPFFQQKKITNNQEIRAILKQAIEERCFFEIQLEIGGRNKGNLSSRRKTNIPVLRSQVDYIGRDSITYIIKDIKPLSKNWKNKKVSLFFQIQTPEGLVHYTFVSKIYSTEPYDKKVCNITIMIPTLLERRKQRSFLRITPTEKCLSGAAVWFGNDLPSENFMRNIELWPIPSCILIPREVEEFSISNISAGGTQLILDSFFFDPYTFPIDNLTKVILMLDLHDVDNEDSYLRFFIECQVRRASMSTDKSEVTVGSKFISWAYLNFEGKVMGEHEPLNWFLLSKADGIDLLGSWIMRYHRSLFRGVPLE